MQIPYKKLFIGALLNMKTGIHVLLLILKI